MPSVEDIVKKVSDMGRCMAMEDIESASAIQTWYSRLFGRAFADQELPGLVVFHKAAIELRNFGEPSISG